MLRVWGLPCGSKAVGLQLVSVGSAAGVSWGWHQCRLVLVSVGLRTVAGGCWRAEGCHRVGEQ